MKRLFVSQPMNGKTDEEILQERMVAVEKAKVILDDDVELIDSYIEEDAPEGYNPGLWYQMYLERSIYGRHIQRSIFWRVL